MSCTLPELILQRGSLPVNTAVWVICSEWLCREWRAARTIISPEQQTTLKTVPTTADCLSFIRHDISDVISNTFPQKYFAVFIILLFFYPQFCMTPRFCCRMCGIVFLQTSCFSGHHPSCPSLYYHGVSLGWRGTLLGLVWCVSPKGTVCGILVASSGVVASQHKEEM